jgi:hypothetical protein
MDALLLIMSGGHEDNPDCRYGSNLFRKGREDEVLSVLALRRVVRMDVNVAIGSVREL